MIFHFIRPQWLLAWIPCILIAWRLFHIKRHANKWNMICDSHLLPYVLQVGQGVSRNWPIYLLMLAWSIAVFALAGPTWQKRPEPVYHTQAATVIALDLSPSMLAEDIKPSRAKRAIFKVDDILQHLKDGQTGMIAFTSEPFIVSPLTQDAATIAAMVPTLSPNMMPVGGSDIGKALEKAAALIHQGGQQRGHIILLSDSMATAKDRGIAKRLARAGILTSVISIGTAKGAPVATANGFMRDSQGHVILEKSHGASLLALASAGDGRFSSFTNNDADVKTMIAQSAKSHALMSGEKVMRVRTNIWKDEGHWFILLLLPIALLIFRRPWLSEL